MLKNRERVSQVAAHVAGHFRETVEPAEYKALLVAVDREACALYKKELDKRLPPEYSAVVISAAHNGPPELAEFHLSEDGEGRIRKAFRKPEELPKILIVTEKLLSGFDAPILYCMYLDKPMRDHMLLQAIARVNRPHEDEEGRRKPAGFVLDFVGIFDKLESALAFDSEEVQGVVEGIDVLRRRFENLVDEGRDAYLPLWAGLRDDKATEAVLWHFRDREPREEFYRYFREIEELYEILSPDPFLRSFLKDYEELTGMYRVVRANYAPHAPVDRSFMRKTALLVQEHTATYSVGGSGDEFRLTAKTLEQLTELVGEQKEAERAWREMNLSPDGFAVFWSLKREGVKGAEEAARRVAAALEEHPHWRRSERGEREVRRILYKALLGAGTEQITELTEHLMSTLRKSSS